MVSAADVFRYFPDLTDRQREQIEMLGTLYAWHNERVNLISRKDMDQFYIHHVLHSLALAKVCEFKPGQMVIDIGTGGGFPGIPLSILYPQTRFTLCDSIGKKIRVVQDVIASLELENAEAVNERTEKLGQKYDIATARAVAPMTELWGWMKGQWKGHPRYYLLKGGDLAAEMNELLDRQPGLNFQVTNIADLFDQPFFATKKVITITG